MRKPGRIGLGSALSGMVPKINQPKLDIIGSAYPDINILGARDLAFPGATLGLRRTVEKATLSWLEPVEALRKQQIEIGAGLTRAIRGFQDSFRPFDRLSEHFDEKQELEYIGLLPHITTPWDLYDPDHSHLFAEKALAYFREQWASVERQLSEIVEKYGVSAEAKEAFGDALFCHRNGKYRSVVLTVMPTIEAEFRRSFEKGPGDQAASLEELRESVMQAPARIAFGHIGSVELITALDEQIYSRVKTSEAVEECRQSEVPNRHAAIHGLVVYKSEKASLNSLFLVEYVFYLIDWFQRHLKED